MRREPERNVSPPRKRTCKAKVVPAEAESRPNDALNVQQPEHHDEVDDDEVGGADEVYEDHLDVNQQEAQREPSETQLPPAQAKQKSKWSPPWAGDHIEGPAPIRPARQIAVVAPTPAPRRGQPLPPRTGEHTGATQVSTPRPASTSSNVEDRPVAVVAPMRGQPKRAGFTPKPSLQEQ